MTGQESNSAAVKQPVATAGNGSTAAAGSITDNLRRLPAKSGRSVSANGCPEADIREPGKLAFFFPRHH